MPLTLADIDKWDTGSIRDVARALSNTATSMTDIQSGFKKLPHVGNWSGIAADAANQEIDHLGKYLTENATARQESGKAMGHAADEIDAIKQILQHVKDEARDGRFTLDMVAGTVTPQGDKCDKSTLADLQMTIKQVLAAGTTADADLAHAVNLSDSVEPASVTMFDGKPVYTAAHRNETDAFKQVFGHAPTTPADWQTAAMLDPTSYDPKYKGIGPEITAAKIEPQPGKGVVQINGFIPGEKVWNFGYDRGDKRGFDANSLPEHSRVNMLIDYNNGVVIARQNPSVDAETGEVAVGHPSVFVNQAQDGTVKLKYDFADAFMPGGVPAAKLAVHAVDGQIAIQPTDSGFKMGGNITNFPAIEAYHGQQPLLQYMPSLGNDPLGPALQLPPHHDFGDTSLLNQFTQYGAAGRGEVPLPIAATQLGPVTNLPTVPVR